METRNEEVKLTARQIGKTKGRRYAIEGTHALFLERAFYGYVTYHPKFVEVIFGLPDEVHTIQEKIYYDVVFPSSCHALAFYREGLRRKKAIA